MKRKRTMMFPKAQYRAQMEKRGKQLKESLADPAQPDAALQVLEEMYMDALPAQLGGEMSLEMIKAAVQRACKAYHDADDRYVGENIPYDHHRVVATFPSAVVYCGEDEKCYQVGYRMEGTNAVIEPGEPVEVTAEFKAVAEAQLAESVALIEAKPAGSIKHARIDRNMRVIEGATLIGALSTNGAHKKRRYSEAALKKITEMAEGLPGYINHVKPEDAFKPRDVREIAIRHRNVRYDPTTQTVRSDMHVAEHHAPLVFGLAETFGDHIGNSLVSKGLVTMEGDVEVVHDVVQLRSADLVSDPATTKGLFEGRGGADHPISILDLVESMKQSNKPPAQGGETVDIAAILTHLKDKPEDQKLLAEHFGFVLKPDAQKLSESVAALTGERDALKGKIAEHEKAIGDKDKQLNEAKVELDGFKAKDALAAKRVKLVEAIQGHQLGKEFGKIKDAISDEFKTLLEGMDETTWSKHLDDRYKALKGVPAGQAPRSHGKDPQILTEGGPGGGLPEGIHQRLASAVRS